MNYIVGIFIILLILGIGLSIGISIIKHVLFNPVVNSIIVGILHLCLLIMCIREAFKVSGDYEYWLFMIGITVLVLIDCIWDIVHAKQYYRDIEIEIDKRFVIKSLFSILTIGFSRVVSLCILRPIYSIRTLLHIKKTMRDGYPLWIEGDYYYMKWIRKLEKKGMIVSNIKTVNDEEKICREKLDRLYPKNISEKVVDIVAGDKEVKDNRKDAEKKLQSMGRYYAYLSTDIFEQYPKLITDVMKEKGCHSVSDIKKFEELKPLHLLHPLSYGNVEWSEYFIIQALQPLVSEGVFEENQYNDKDVFDNHIYRHVAGKPIKSIDADSNPLLALDD